MSKSIEEKIAARDLAGREHYQSYTRGWIDGAAVHALDERYTRHQTRPDLKQEYEKGYSAGSAARRLALNVAAKRLHWKPSILRATGVVDVHR